MRALEYLLNFKTNKASFRDANGNVKALKESFVGLGKTVTDIKDKIGKFASSQKWVNITQLASTAANSIGNIATKIKSTFVESYRLIDGIATDGDKIAKTSRLLGLSVKEFQQFGYAANLSGVNAETLESSMKRLSVTIGKAKAGDKGSLKIFDALLPKNIQSYKDTSSVMLDLADAYAKMNDSQRSMVSNSIFGRGGLEMANMLSGGSAGLGALFSRYDALGGGMSDEMATNAEKFKDDLADVQVTFKAMKYTVGGALLPAFSKIFKSFTNFFTKNKESISRSIDDIAVKLVKGVEKLVPKIPDILDGFMKIADFVGVIFEKLGPVKSLIGIGILGSLKDVLPLLTALSGGITSKLVPAIGLATVGFEAWKSVFKSIDKNLDMLANTSFSEFCDAVYMLAEETVMKIHKKLKETFPNLTAWMDKKTVRSAAFFNYIDEEQLKKDFGLSIDELAPYVGGNKGKELEEFLREKRKNVLDEREADVKNVNNRFVVDFKNMPQGVKVTPPPSGDFDYSYGYIFNPN